MIRSLIAGFLVASLLAFNWPWHKKTPPPKAPVQLYNEGLSYMSHGWGRRTKFNPPDFDRARKSFQEIVYDHPTSKFAPMAELRISDSYYEQGDYDLSANAYDAWRKSHVGRPELPYVSYRLAMSYYHQTMTIDRDQTNTRQALLEFQSLVMSYPNTEYAAAVGDKTEILKTKLAKHELYVGKFYFRHNDYWAAIDRFQVILDNFPKRGLDEQAFYWSWRSYVELKNFDEARKQYAMLNERFPSGKLTRRAKMSIGKKSSKGTKQWLKVP